MWNKLVENKNEAEEHLLWRINKEKYPFGGTIGQAVEHLQI